MATNRLYRSNYGEIFGVCKGFAQWRDLPVGAVRLTCILIAVFTAVFPCLVIYVILGIFLPANPSEKPSRPGDNGDGNRYRRNSRHAYGSDPYKRDGERASGSRRCDYAGADEYEDVSDDDEDDDDDEELRRRYEELKRKVEDMEASVLDKENDWDARFKRGEKTSNPDSGYGNGQGDSGGGSGQSKSS